MTDQNSDEHALRIAAARREQRVRTTVESLFRRCESSKNPILAYSRACSKVGYLARDGVRSELRYLESALNERKHALVMERCGHPEKAKEHHRTCGQDLRSFQRAIRIELARPREPLSTPELRERIHRNLDVGQWSRARSDLDELTQRADLDRRLPELDKYSQSWNLDEQRFAAIQGRIEQCNAMALERCRALGGQRAPSEPGTPNGATPSSTSRTPATREPAAPGRSVAVHPPPPRRQGPPCAELLPTRARSAPSTANPNRGPER